MTVDEESASKASDRLRKDGGHPHPTELRVRLARLEEKQDAQTEKLDYITEQLDGRLSTVNDRVERMMPRHRRMWLVYRGGKWLIGALLAGGATIKITGWM